MSVKILIIEDEPLISMDLEALLEGLGHEVCGIARTQSEALKMVPECEPNLILADIQLGDGSSGLDAINELKAANHAVNTPVVFITAYPERFLIGQQPPSAWLLAKPFQPEIVVATINAALEAQTTA
jgi:CheY-like chemotaxis protein